MEPIHHVE